MPGETFYAFNQRRAACKQSRIKFEKSETDAKFDFQDPNCPSIGSIHGTGKRSLNL